MFCVFRSSDSFAVSYYSPSYSPCACGAGPTLNGLLFSCLCCVSDKRKVGHGPCSPCTADLKSTSVSSKWAVSNMADCTHTWHAGISLTACNNPIGFCFATRPLEGFILYFSDALACNNILILLHCLPAMCSWACRTTPAPGRTEF